MIKTEDLRWRGLLLAGAALAAAISGLAAGTVAEAQDAPTPPAASAAAPPGKSTAQMDAGEPRAAASPAGEAVEHSAAPAKRTAAGAGAGAAGRPAGTSGSKAPAASDRLDLGTATVTGDREQPKVMYIVPWKSADVGDLSGKPMNSLLDEALAPVDRDEFRREVAYYDAVKAERPPGGPPTLKQVEK